MPDNNNVLKHGIFIGYRTQTTTTYLLIVFR